MNIVFKNKIYKALESYLIIYLFSTRLSFRREVTQAADLKI